MKKLLIVFLLFLAAAPVFSQQAWEIDPAGWSLAGVASWTKAYYQTKIASGTALPAPGDPSLTPEGYLFILTSSTADPSLWRIEGQEWKPLAAPVPENSDFLSLTDTPSDYAGQQGKGLVVNFAEDGLEFADLWAPVTTVFGRTGDIIASSTDYAAYYASKTTEILVGNKHDKAFYTEPPVGYHRMVDPGAVALVQHIAAPANVSTPSVFAMSLAPYHGYGAVSAAYISIYGAEGSIKNIQLTKQQYPNTYATNAIALDAFNELPGDGNPVNPPTITLDTIYSGTQFTYISHTGTLPVDSNNLYFELQASGGSGGLIIYDSTYETIHAYKMVFGEGQYTLNGGDFSITVQIDNYMGWEVGQMQGYWGVPSASGFTAQSFTWSALIGGTAYFLQKSPLTWVTNYPTGNDLTGGEPAVGLGVTIGHDNIGGWLGVTMNSREFYQNQTSVYAMLDALKERLQQTQNDDIRVFIKEPALSNEILLFEVFARGFTLPLNLVGSKAIVTVNPSTETVLIVKKVSPAGSASNIGTITISTGGVVTFACSATSFLPGDGLQIVAPAVATDLQSASFCIKTRF